MVRIMTEVRNGAVRFNVSVQAQSIERALEIVELQNPGRECKVSFPIDAEAFFDEDDIVTQSGRSGWWRETIHPTSSVAKQHGQRNEERTKRQCLQDSRRLLT